MLIAAKAVAFMAMPEFADYARQVVANAESSPTR